jgi:ABC-type transport system involved in multi-copper enzyme maturation permease subunit
MNPTAFLHLAWKEYRAVRAFWLSVVVLVVLLQLLSLALAANPTEGATAIYSLAIGAPAFFALGCAGAAFAVEQEEGTYDFLRASPIPGQLVLASKLAVTILATACLLVVLLLLPVLIARHSPSLLSSVPSRAIWGVWGMAAVEALAWGTFFSLLTARPLLAICLALFAASTIAHMLAWSTSPYSVHTFELAPYLAAVPRRALVAGVVLAVDVVLGLRWLDHGDAPVALPTLSTIFRRKQRDEALAGGVADAKANAKVATSLLGPNRITTLRHLVWQHCRQSGWLMILMAGLFVAVTLWTIFSGVDSSNEAAIYPMALMAALAGACVFLTDQERRRYAFFVEHNVPPRLVWLSRQVPFIVTIALATSVICLLWLDSRRLIQAALMVSSDIGYWQDWRMLLPEGLSWPPLLLGLTAVAVAYSAGQWASMHLRSGVLAGFVGVLLAGLLCSWVFLIDFMYESWFFFVLPIPLVLLWATWRRAPDWIRENTSTMARVWAAAAVIVPAACLVGLLALARVKSIARVEPGFDPDAYLAQITPEARATAALYRKVNDLYSKRTPQQGQKEYLEENSEALTLVLEASRRPSCVLDDPRTASAESWPRNSGGLLNVVLQSATQLQDEGKLDEALDRYFAALAIISQWSNLTASRATGRISFDYLVNSVFLQFPRWGAKQGQTVERIKGAILRLRGWNDNALHVDDGLKSNWVMLREFLAGSRSANEALSEVGNGTTRQNLWLTLLPWETARERRRLNVLTAGSLNHLDGLRQKLEHGEAVVYDLPLASDEWHPWPSMGDGWMMDGPWGGHAAKFIVEIEDCKRGTMIVLALQAYRLEHSQLPDSLDELVGSYLDKLPVDPYSGYSFVYFPKGLPEPRTPLEEVELQRAQPYSSRLQLGEPGIWSTGPQLLAEAVSAYDYDPALDVIPVSRKEAIQYRDRPYYPNQALGEILPSYIAWAKGHWFPIR